MVKQLRLFERPPLDLIQKLRDEIKKGRGVKYHWNGK